MRNRLVSVLRWALAAILIALAVGLVLLFPFGMIYWAFNPHGWKFAVAGLPFLLTAIHYTNKIRNGF